MTVFLNGKFVPDDQALVSVHDRGFRYGDGLFETVLVSNGKPFRWAQHFARLERSAAFLKIAVPNESEPLQAAIRELISRNQIAKGIVRVALSRGVGPRGYVPSGIEKPTLVISAEPLLPLKSTSWKISIASLRVAVGDLLSQHKSSSRLFNVVAAMEAKERGADEALLVDTNGHVTEGASSNVFWIQDGCLFTPPVTAGALPGVTRAVVTEICAELSLPLTEQSVSPEAMIGSDGMFLSLSSRGVIAVSEIDGRKLRQSPIVASIADAYQKLVQRECA